MSWNNALSLDGPLWRRLALWGSSRGPEWFVRLSPPVIGLVVCVMAGTHRRRVLSNLRRLVGKRPLWRESIDVARTFTTYASCLAEILGSGSRRARLPVATASGDHHLRDALADGRGVLLATAHTAGWETVGPVLSRDHALRVMIAEVAERDTVARAIQDKARQLHGVVVAHVGDDPLAALPLARHLRDGGVVALQIDRVPPGVRARSVTMFGAEARVPEGPLRLAMLTGAPLLPVFSARTGHRRYAVVAHPPVRLARTATEAELDAAAQTLADAMLSFVRKHPTQWFHFRDE